MHTPHARRARLLAALAAISACSAAPAEVSLRFEPPAQDAPPASADASTPAPAAAPAAAPAPTTEPATLFLDKGWRAISFGGGVAFASDSTDTSAVVTFHTFIAKDFEFNLSLAGWYYAQDEDGDDEQAKDAVGINPAFGFRWHFWNSATQQQPQDRSWSLYADIGIGMTFSNEDVPPDGTRYNFTPRAGLGATFALGDDGTRLDLGVRWHHISNASTSGTDDNPSRDGVMIYAGVMFPF